VEFHKQTHKNVYVLASHSHFFMNNVHKTACRRDHSEDVSSSRIGNQLADGLSDANQY
jgi:hypothetical protein